MSGTIDSLATAKCKSGYKGVYPARGNRWQAQFRHKALGGYATAYEAGVAVARAVQREEAGGDYDDADDDEHSEEEAVAKEEARDEDGDDGDVVTSVAGVALHLSARNGTGYQGVFRTCNGKFVAQCAHAYLGTFITAVDAALAYARHVRRVAGVADDTGGEEEAIPLDDVAPMTDDPVTSALACCRPESSGDEEPDIEGEEDDGVEDAEDGVEDEEYCADVEDEV